MLQSSQFYVPNIIMKLKLNLNIEIGLALLMNLLKSIPAYLGEEWKAPGKLVHSVLGGKDKTEFKVESHNRKNFNNLKPVEFQ